MRLYQSIKNAVGGLFLQLTVVILGLVSQALFIRYLGIQYAGISGTLNNVISMLSLAELGVGTAMTYSLYKPLAQKNIEKVKSLMRLYKRVYQIIGLVIGCIGLLMMPFVPYWFKGITIDINLYLVFGLYLTNTVISYFYTYKRSILYANQTNYLNNIVTVIFTFLLHGLQIGSMIIFKNYYLYLLIRIVVMMSENVFISYMANKQHPYLKDKFVEPLEVEEKKIIISNIKALFFHKVGGVVVLGTDNLIVSSLIGVTTAGIFGTYQLVTRYLLGFGATIISSATASFGNLLSTEPDKAYPIFNKIYYLNFFIAVVSSCCLINCLHPFIQLFAGEINVFSFQVEIVMVIAYYIHSMRASIGIGKDAAGIYRQDKFVPLWEAFVNLTLSLFFVRIFGVVGIILGTILSTLLSVFISVPYFTFKEVYNQPVILYYKKYAYYCTIFIISAFLSLVTCSLFTTTNFLLEFLKNGLLSCFVSIICILLFTHKQEEFKYFSILLKNISKSKSK